MCNVSAMLGSDAPTETVVHGRLDFDTTAHDPVTTLGLVVFRDDSIWISNSESIPSNEVAHYVTLEIRGREVAGFSFGFDLSDGYQKTSESIVRGIGELERPLSARLHEEGLTDTLETLTSTVQRLCERLVRPTTLEKLRGGKPHELVELVRSPELVNPEFAELRQISDQYRDRSRQRRAA